jgi:uncharacterized protein (UPF0276 family)
MSSLDRKFWNRAKRLPARGIGLSVDVFTPDLLQLHHALEENGTRPDYLEVFKAPTAELARVRAALPDTAFAYHGEGLWLIDPEMRTRYLWEKEVRTIACHAETLGAAWINHECASKQFMGYSFGTYLPPLFTKSSAAVAAAHVMLCQERLDHWYEARGNANSAPLILLEVPPLTYFAFGDLTSAEFFASLVERAACGLVLDIGHLWTMWRYREQTRGTDLRKFTQEFLDVFPLSRVIQIHIAGLACAAASEPHLQVPAWIDAHAAPVPPVLWDLLHQVLAHPGLTSLKGVALEVDTKAISLIVQEFDRLRSEAGQACFRERMPEPIDCNMARRSAPGEIPSDEDAQLSSVYTAYARVISGQESLEHSLLECLSEHLDREGLRRYTAEYLPEELLTWGGDLEYLFPRIWQALRQRGISGEDFVRFWFHHPASSRDAYDFFYIKLDRWISFLRQVAPDLVEETAREAAVFRSLHAELNDEPNDLEALIKPSGNSERNSNQ